MKLHHRVTWRMRRPSWSRIATGVLIVVVGVALLLITTDTVEPDLVWTIIPGIFVLIGLWALIRSGFRNLVGPVMVIAIAGAFLLESIDLIEEGTIGTYWPLFIVLLGLLVIVNRSRRRRGQTTGDASVSLVGVFAGDSRRVTGQQFRGGEATVVFGDAELDLRETELDADGALVEATAIFGDIVIDVPDDWPIDLEVMTIFGDIQDRRSRGVEPDSTGPRLTLTGSVIFGDITIRD